MRRSSRPKRSSRMLRCIMQKVRQIFVLKRTTTVCSPLHPAESPVVAIRLHSLHLLNHPLKVLHSQRLRVLTLEELTNELLNPLLILRACSRMPPIQAIKLNRADVSATTLE